MKRQDGRDAKELEEPDAETDRHVSELLAAAIEVHRVLGPGFLESVYERSVRRAWAEESAISAAGSGRGRVQGQRVGESSLDVLIADRVVVELEAVEALAPIHWVQVRSYLKATGYLLGLLIDFNVPVLLRGVRRIILMA